MGAPPPNPRDLSHSTRTKERADSPVGCPSLVPVPESALGSHPCVALSSAQATVMIAHGRGRRRYRRGHINGARVIGAPSAATLTTTVGVVGTTFSATSTTAPSRRHYRQRYVRLQADGATASGRVDDGGRVVVGTTVSGHVTTAAESSAPPSAVRSRRCQARSTQPRGTFTAPG